MSDRASWDVALATCAPPTFLQSWEWGETQETLGEQVIRLEAVEEHNIVGIAQAVTVTARRATFLHVPHGPIAIGNSHPTSLSPLRQGFAGQAELRGAGQGAGNREILIALLEAVRDEARQRGLHFLRVSPIQEDAETYRNLYRNFGFRPAPIHVHAERLWILNLAPAEEILLAHMRKTTRNLIRRAEREGVQVRISTSLDDVALFQRLYAETARREHFAPFSERDLATEFRSFAVHGNAAFLIAEHRGTPLSAAMVLFTPWSAFYHHGASSRDRPRIPAAYALQWAAIREAKQRGCREYNFWGIAPPTSEVERKNFGSWRSHPWKGLTLFKTGFGGREVPLVPTQDLPLSARYWPAYALEVARRWKRGL